MENKNEISWKAREYVYYEKNPGWYIIIGVIGLLVLAYALLTRDYTMFVTLLVVLIVGVAFAARKPRTITVTLSGSGLAVGREAYPFSNLKSFWIVYRPPEVKVLYLETTNYVNRDLTVQLENQDPNEVRKFLLKFLPEDLRREEEYVEQLLRKLRF
jgi:hypothetical protein